jgi:Amt family ammonium transporter
MGKRYPFFLLAASTILCLLFVPEYVAYNPATDGPLDGADITWMLVATALVLLMTPGLAFFYGGMVNRRNVISTMMQSFICMGVVSVLWIMIGYSMAFGDSIGGVIGDPRTFLFFKDVTLAPKEGQTIPHLLFAFFQMKFAVITPALITGSFAERVRFRSYLLFTVLFILFIYAPLCHMTWGGGIFEEWGVLDFAGGTVVHMSAGFAALAGAFYLGKRKHVSHDPANVPYVILGTAMLWFGWFGFNAGSELAANSNTVIALANTMMASAAAMIAWAFFDRMRNRKMSAVGACIGAVVGLVAITPAAGFVSLGESIFIGGISAVISNLAVDFKNSTSLDDTLDVFPCHGLGGIVGMILTAIFAGASEGGLLATGGNFGLIGAHLGALLITGIFSFFGSLLLFKIVDALLHIRVTESQEFKGLDLSQHGESILEPEQAQEILESALNFEESNA